MKNLKFLSIALAAAFLMLPACASTKIEMPEVDIKAFEKRSTYQFNMPVNSKCTGVTLLSVPQRVLANIGLVEDAKNVLYVKLYENEKLNIDRHLIRNLEYVYDREDHVLKVIFDLPVVYMLSGAAHFRIQAGVARKSGDMIAGSRIGKQIAFFWAPRVWVTEQESNHVVMKYVDPMKKEYDKKDELIRKAGKEIFMTNMERLDSDYQSLIKSFVNRGAQ